MELKFDKQNERRSDSKNTYFESACIKKMNSFCKQQIGLFNKVRHGSHEFICGR